MCHTAIIYKENREMRCDSDSKIAKGAQLDLYFSMSNSVFLNFLCVSVV